MPQYLPHDVAEARVNESHGPVPVDLQKPIERFRTPGWPGVDNRRVIVPSFSKGPAAR